jgi:hypothetical protein
MMIRSILGIEKTPIKFSINLYREDATVQAGQKLEGKVVVEVKSKEPIPGEAVQLFVTGREKVKVAVEGERKHK